MPADNPMSDDTVLAEVGRLQGRFDGLESMLREQNHNLNRRLEDKFGEIKDDLRHVDQDLADIKERADKAKSAANDADAKAETALDRTGRISAFFGTVAGVLASLAVSGLALIFRKWLDI